MTENVMCEERLSEARLRLALGVDGEHLSIYAYQTLDSTNQRAKLLAMEMRGDDPVLIVAESQTSGRGRMGRSFYSPQGTGIYFSVLYRPQASLHAAVSVTCAASVAVMRAIRKLTGVQTQIKWVNDLYWNGKKVCGILTEAVTSGGGSYVIVGIGVNLSTDSFPSELTDKAGSLGCDTISRADWIAAIYRELIGFLRDPQDHSWLQDYRACSCVIGKRITWVTNDQSFEGTAVGIDAHGGLQVRLPDGEHRVLRTGEISIFVTPEQR